MNATGQTICLCMIVKNENHVLRRCLDSVQPLIDTWVIVDTGSTDGTQDLVREYFHELPGELIERPWVNFGHNRSESLAYARGRADYVLIMDADEFLELEPGFEMPQLTADAYDFRMGSGSIQYYKIQLAKDSLPWRFEGVLHEFITCDRPHVQEHLPGLMTIRLQEGARSHDPVTYRKDALLLEEAVLKEPLNTRHMFYLAQSYRDANEPDTAINRYQRRIAMGGWEEEIWYSLYQIAALQDGRTPFWPVVLEAYLAAFQYRPTRAEPLYRIALHYQKLQQPATAMLFLSHAMQLPYPTAEVLFVEWEVYDYLIPLEYAVACFYLGRHIEAIHLNNRLLANKTLTPEQVEKLTTNRRFSLDALQPPLDQNAGEALPEVVVIVIFDEAHPALDRCIDSLRNQEGRATAVFVNNGSDRSAEGPLMTTNFPIKRTGGGASWARCVRLAAEEVGPNDILLLLSPHDALIDRNCCKEVATQFQRYGCDLMYGQFRWDDGRRGDAVPVASADEFVAAKWSESSFVTLAVRKRLLDEANFGEEDMPVNLFDQAGYERTRFIDREIVVHQA